MQVKDDLYYPVACRHHGNLDHPAGLAVVTIGNQLRSDDGIAMAVCDALPESLLKRVCRFDLGPYSYYLIDCLSGHQSAIVIDSTMSDNPPGALTVLDLGEIIGADSPLKLHFSHGMSLVDELRVGRWRGLLPKAIFFVGIEAASTDWGARLSDTLEGKVPQLVSDVSKLIELNLEQVAADA